MTDLSKPSKILWECAQKNDFSKILFFIDSFYKYYLEYFSLSLHVRVFFLHFREIEIK